MFEYIKFKRAINCYNKGDRRPFMKFIIKQGEQTVSQYYDMIDYNNLTNSEIKEIQYNIKTINKSLDDVKFKLYAYNRLSKEEAL